MIRTAPAKPGHNSGTSVSTDLKAVFAAARPLIEQWLDVGEQIGALREVATERGLDWSQVKALLKAQIQDERDETGDGKRVKRIVEKAEFASAYADMLGLANMNEKKYFGAESVTESSDGKASGSEHPSAESVSPPARNHIGGDRANAGGDDVNPPGMLMSNGTAPVVEQTSLAAREGEKSLHSNSPDDDGLDIPEFLRRPAR